MLARDTGIRVLPEQRWNLFDPSVIRWRLASPARGTEHVCANATLENIP
ncbi:hypothetical protein [Okibacterium endophyticum]